jgi:hypothetical protein
MLEVAISPSDPAHLSHLVDFGDDITRLDQDVTELSAVSRH